jgi:hypothetical protein
VIQWEITQISSEEDSELLEKHLKEGWEPFSAAIVVKSTYLETVYFLRRSKQVFPMRPKNE